MWDNVDRIVQIIESQIDFIYHTTYLYKSRFRSTENEDRSLQSSHFIRKSLQINKPLGFEYELKNIYIYTLINSYISCKVVISLEEKIIN